MVRKVRQNDSVNDIIVNVNAMYPARYAQNKYTGLVQAFNNLVPTNNVSSDGNNLLEKEPLELSKEQLERNDEIFNAIHNLCKLLTEDSDLEYDMYYIGEITEFVCNTLICMGKRIRFPGIKTHSDGHQEIIEYYEPDELLGE